MKVGIIGLGNIGHALAEGFIESNKQVSLFAYDHNENAFIKAKNDFINVEFENSVESIIEKSELIFVCIRTEQVEKFLTDNFTCFKNIKTLVFIQAGIKNDFLVKAFQKSEAVAVRAITNINVASLNGFTFVLPTAINKANKIVNDVFAMVGKVQTVERESQLDLLSLLTGCTPALIATFYDAMIESGVAIGISQTQTEELINDTMQKTLRTLNNNKLNPMELKKRVCTVGGTVEATMKKLENETSFRQQIVNWLPEIFASLQ